MKKIMTKLRLLTLCGLATVFTFSSCDVEDAVEDVVDILTPDGGYNPGWLAEDENNAEIEDDINLYNNDDNSNFKSRIDLSSHLPAIGDQGQYGTCVAWAVGYNCRSFLYSKAKNETKLFSPADLFMSISSDQKGADCGGTNFEVAFDQLISRGVATMSTADYSNINCSGSPSSSWEADASLYKIKSYREITEISVNKFKQYLNAGRLIVFGAKLGDEFMYADDNSVLTQQTTFDYTGIHSYHAMVCCGYDDTMGPNGAFRIANSWGTSWGDDGYLWVDQNFFVSSDFVYSAYVAYNCDEDEVELSSNQVSNVSSGSDLLAYQLSDQDYYADGDSDSDDPLWRTAYYNVYNAGSTSVTSSQNWSICYLYYNAYNANDYGVILCDYYSDKLANPTISDGVWDATEANNLLGLNAQGYCYNSNVTVSSGHTVAEAQGGSSFEWSYKMPETLNGSYYLVLIADAFNNISESSEDNNYYYFGQSDGQPLKITNGVIETSTSKMFKCVSKSSVKPKQNAPSEFQSVQTPTNVNAYSPQTISAMLNYERKNGNLAKKAAQWRENSSTCVKTRKIVR